MRAMVLHRPGQPLVMEERPDPTAGPAEVRIRVEACAVCRTDLHVVDGELPEPKLPLIPGHEIVGVVEQTGDAVTALAIGQRVGVPWLGHTCGHCAFCQTERENLCDTPLFTGYTRDGGFATHVIADASFAFPLPAQRDAVSMAPWLCAGLIGWRSLRMAGEARRIGLYGFGAAAHLIIQVCRRQGREVYVFTREGDVAAQDLARSLGAAWAGSSDSKAPCELEASIIFAPAGELVPKALSDLQKGGRVICGGIHMSDIPTFPYRLLWQERQIRSVANLTRQDALEFLAIAERAEIKSKTNIYPLAAANEALGDLRAGRFQGAAVLVP